MTIVKITRSPYSNGVNLDVNGQKAHVPAEGKTGDIPEEMLPALADSHIEFEIVGAADEAAVGAGGLGNEGDAAAEAEPEPPVEPEPEPNPDVNDEANARPVVDLALLDGTVAKIVPKLAELSDEQVNCLLNAEQAGKTRSTLIAAMNERLNPPQE